MKDRPYNQVKDGKKRCPKCNRVKSVALHFDVRTKGGIVRPYCRMCTRALYQEWYRSRGEDYNKVRAQRYAARKHNIRYRK